MRGFEEPRQVLARIDPQRFARLEAFAGAHLAHLPLQEDAADLGLDLAACVAAVADQQRLAERGAAAFAPFEGHWLGGDIHDAARIFRHIWYPTEVGSEFAGQKVLMLDAANRVTLAYDFCELVPRLRITGLVGQRAHRGYALPDGALLWLGEEPEGQVSIHLERVQLDGQLYDVRGMVVALVAGGVEVRARSDWRYHRLSPGAVSSPLD